MATTVDLRISQATTVQQQQQSSCKLNEGGLYGEPSDSTTVYEVEFLYQIHVMAGTSEAVLRGRVMPTLEMVATEQLLPAFFDCNNDNNSRQRRFLQTGVIEAVSSRPVDEIVLRGRKCSVTCCGRSGKIALVGFCILTLMFHVCSVPCNGDPRPGSDCYVVEGKISLFTTNFRNQEEVDSVVLPVIQMILQGNALSEAIPQLTDTGNLNSDLSLMEPLPTTPTQPSAPMPTAPMTPTPPVAPTAPAVPTVLVPTAPTEPTVVPPAQPPVAVPTRPVPSRPPNQGPTIPVPPGTPTSTPMTTRPPIAVPSEPTAPIVTSSPVRPLFPPEPTAAPADPPTIISSRGDGDDDSFFDNWWSWLIIGGGVAVVGVFAYGALKTPGGSAPTAGKVARSDEDAGDDAYLPPSTTMDTYEPPPRGSHPQDDAFDNRAATYGNRDTYDDDDEESDPFASDNQIGQFAFTQTNSGLGSVDEGEPYYDDEQQQEEEEEEEEYVEDEEYEEEVEYEEEEYEEEQEGTGGEYSEESYYEEEEEVVEDDQQHGQWG